jgi:hypothetical protein
MPADVANRRAVWSGATKIKSLAFPNESIEAATGLKAKPSIEIHGLGISLGYGEA